jgi:hypothetical protein
MFWQMTEFPLERKLYYSGAQTMRKLRVFLFVIRNYRKPNAYLKFYSLRSQSTFLVYLPVSVFGSIA